MDRSFKRSATSPLLPRGSLRLRGIVAALPVIFALSFPTAQADPIEFHYGGVITSADDGTGVNPGARFDGTFTYDPRANPMATLIENGHFYTFGQTGFAWSPTSAKITPTADDTSDMSLTIDGKLHESRQGGLGLTVYEVQSDDKFNPNPQTQLNIYTPGGVQLSLSNPDRAVFGSLDIPDTISLADFPNAKITQTRWDADRGAFLTFEGTVDTLSQLTVTAVPEPGSVALWVGLAAGAWAVRARRRT